MSNSNQNAKYNVADERRIEHLENKYRVKGAHERDVTGISRLLYVTMHIGSFVGAMGSLYYMTFSGKVEGFLYCVLFGVLGVVNEYMKGKKMEYFSVLTLISSDQDQPKEVRDNAYDDRLKALLPLAVFWLVSIGAIAYTGYSWGHTQVAATYVEPTYDEQIKQRAVTADAVLKKALNEDGVPQRTIKAYQTEAKTALTDWTNHKKTVDAEKKSTKADNEDGALVRGIIYCLIGIFYEACLFFARLWHEKEQYAVLKSKKAASPTPSRKRETPNDDADDVAVLKRELKDLAAAFKTQAIEKNALERLLKTGATS